MNSVEVNKKSTILFILFFGLLCIIFINNHSYNQAFAEENNDLIIATDTIRDTVFVEKIIHDTVEVTHYVDTSVIVLQKKAFLYIKDTFNIGDRTFYVTENDDTVKVFYHDYTYYIFKYFFQDTLVTVDSVIGCDLYTHCICDDRERVVIFHTCEGESRMIINMLNKQGK